MALSRTVILPGRHCNKLLPPVHRPKAPLVFCRGLLGFDTVTACTAIAPLHLSHWHGVDELLQANGREVQYLQRALRSTVHAKIKHDTYIPWPCGTSLDVVCCPFSPNGGGDGKVLESLTLEAMAKFNGNTPDVEEVRSAGAQNISPCFRIRGSIHIPSCVPKRV
ncbi:hypothetical protein EDC04DRAFT_1066866 [Pisolithus marmoratus]|nr:hypothetical protein EDC04DRAFT_1066866 [Pisolithus marmoratus]